MSAVPVISPRDTVRPRHDESRVVERATRRRSRARRVTNVVPFIIVNVLVFGVVFLVTWCLSTLIGESHAAQARREKVEAIMRAKDADAEADLIGRRIEGRMSVSSLETWAEANGFVSRYGGGQQ